VRKLESWSVAPRWITLAALSLFFVLAVAACGDDDDSAEGGDAAVLIATDSGEAVAASAAATPNATDEGGDDGGSSEVTDPCSLLTGADVTGVMGVEYADGVLDEPQCEYMSSDGISSVYARVFDDTEILDADLIFEGEIEAQQMEEFDGPGTRTAWDDSLTVLNALEDDRMVPIQIADLESEAARARAIALMEIALTR
jgi:hypothetical protein